MENTSNLRDKWQKKTALFLFGQVFSVLGSSLVMYAMIWHIILETDSGVMMTISTLCTFVPQIVISLFAGVWADRFNRKKIIILADGGIATVTLVLAILFMMGYKDLWILFVVAALRSVGSGIQTPAIMALLSQLVPSEKFGKVNGINTSLQSVIMLLSPALSALMLANLNISLIFLVDVVTAALATILLLTVKVSDPPKLPERPYFDDMKDGIKVIKNNKSLTALIGFASIIMFLVTPAAILGQLLVKRTFGEELWRLSNNEMAFSLGAILGGLLAGFLILKTRIHTYIMSAYGFGLSIILSGVIPLVLLEFNLASLELVFIFYLITVLIMGIIVPFFNVNAMSIIQENVEPAVLGRVFSIASLASTAAFPIGSLLFGPLSDIISIEWILCGTGILVIVTAIVMQINKSLKGLHVVKTKNTQKEEGDIDVVN